MGINELLASSVVVGSVGYLAYTTYRVYRPKPKPKPKPDVLKWEIGKGEDDRHTDIAYLKCKQWRVYAESSGSVLLVATNVSNHLEPTVFRVNQHFIGCVQLDGLAQIRTSEGKNTVMLELMSGKPITLEGIQYPPIDIPLLRSLADDKLKAKASRSVTRKRLARARAYARDNAL